MDIELEKIKRKKMEEILQNYSKRGINVDKNLPKTPIKLTDADIDENIKKYDKIVVDCWAPWCGPCRMVGPIIDELAKEMSGKMVFGKLNVDENQTTSSKYGIMSIPTLLVFKKGDLIDKIIGALPKDMLKSKLSQY
ncbi:MAG: thioredoxin [Candidatus Thermoplasmatota archaeon]|nr:thioredoxin [Candidatus Thermoplasmatota archaeon]